MPDTRLLSGRSGGGRRERAARRCRDLRGNRFFARFFLSRTESRVGRGEAINVLVGSYRNGDLAEGLLSCAVSSRVFKDTRCLSSLIAEDYRDKTSNRAEGSGLERRGGD